MERLFIVFTTVPNEERGAEIARALVSERLAACINIVPAVRSFYVWEGKLEDEREALLIAKVPASGFARYRDRLRALHPYAVPEVVALEATAVNESYLAWCLTSTT